MLKGEILNIYKRDSIINSIAELIKPNENRHIRLNGISGSLDSIIAASTYKIHQQNHVFVLNEKEEAAYFLSDLRQLLPNYRVSFFPTSYKKAYEFEETENANILQRAEVLNRLNAKYSKGELIVTYPEALAEKVINKKSLVKNTMHLKLGECINLEVKRAELISFGFELVDFVAEPGQFSIRGGIIDLFSFAHDLPYRIELFGDEIESIRTFDPGTQLSVDKINKIAIIPNVQTRLLEEERVSVLDYLPINSKIWLKDIGGLAEAADDVFNKVSKTYRTLLENSSNTKIILKPEFLYENSESILNSLDNYVNIEFGISQYHNDALSFNFETGGQPSFNKNFEILIKHLEENQYRGIQNFIIADQPGQIQRLENIFDELNADLNISPELLSLREGFIDYERKIACYTDHQIFERFFRYKVKEKYSKSKALTLKQLQSLEPGDYVTHIDYGVGRFAGMERKELNGKIQETIRLIYKDDDILLVNVHALHKISKFSGKEGEAPNVNKLGSPDWDNKKKKIKRKVKDIAKDLIELYAKRKATKGYAFSQDSFLQAELESSFIYEDTPDQAKASTAVKSDLEKEYPMDRLICGDVGFGKTEVAIRAAFKVAADGKQTAILVPTTVLALQHFHTISSRLEDFPVRVDYINRFRTNKQIKNTLKDLEDGKIDIIIGTHRLVGKDVKFKNLGLLIIDEEQKFGVKVKEKLKEFRVNVDVLTLTATPIPRTLHFSLMGARDLSVINTPPPNRQPVATEIHVFNEALIRDTIRYELQRGGQVFFVHNRVKNIEELANIIKRLVPDARIGIAHGQMEGRILEKAMFKFVEKEYDVLVSTNIIESGLDIPNANTIIINQAHSFGLSDLHQMRGRVGRSNRKAFCYFLTLPLNRLSADSRKRLKTLEEFSEIGDGFKVAMRDLDIRGAGNLLGREQSGFINDLGFDMYHKILDEAVQELKENEFASLFKNEVDIKKIVKDCNIETDLEVRFPETYIPNVSERLRLYTELDNVKNEKELEEFVEHIKDRFGKLPESVRDLVETARLRWLAEELGFGKLSLKSGKLKGYILDTSNESYFQGEVFGAILNFVKTHPKMCQLKEVKDMLVLNMNNIHGISEAKSALNNIISSIKGMRAFA
ncbi:transcription-repair coupling factor [Hyphobacterium sp. CCMP332]|nr:transcription-repair coupling factor [Hyphobacterium sp. CCMP332]